jgi:hypothetical protein
MQRCFNLYHGIGYCIVVLKSGALLEYHALEQCNRVKSEFQKECTSYYFQP